MNTLEWFKNEAKKLSKTDYTVLEIGTRRWVESKPTHHKIWFPDATYRMTDIQDGLDVDIVSDIHCLSKTFNEESFDIIVACSVFEHLQYPHKAAEEILKVLKKGGLFFVQTHQTFQVHGYPSDYFRYTTEGLKVLFEKASEVQANYEFPCEITTVQFAPMKRCCLNSNIAGRK